MKIMPLIVLLLVVSVAILGCTKQGITTEDNTKTKTDTVVQGEVVSEVDSSLIAEDATDTEIGEMV
jgi:hypothetical protein